MPDTNPSQPTYPITIAGVQRALPLFEVAPGVTIAILNILGDVELVQVAAQALAAQLKAYSIDTLVTAETKSIPLIHVLSGLMAKPYVVFRKSYKPYMGDAISAETRSITTGTTQILYLDAKDRALISGKQIAIVDDVISTGSTLQAMRTLVEKAEGVVSVEAAILTEGDAAKWAGVVALGHLPVFTTPSDPPKAI